MRFLVDECTEPQDRFAIDCFIDLNQSRAVLGFSSGIYSDIAYKFNLALVEIVIFIIFQLLRLYSQFHQLLQKMNVYDYS